MDLPPFAGLVESNQLGQVALMFEAAIAGSFEARPHFMQLTRQSAIKERFKACERIFRVLRGDMKWSVQRIQDHLLVFLLKELDGEAWEPSKGSAWSPDGPGDVPPDTTKSRTARSA